MEAAGVSEMLVNIRVSLHGATSQQAITFMLFYVSSKQSPQS
jgi:hypothetical protein